MGSLPPTGKWVRLKIPASIVGLSGKEIKGVAFVTYNGKAYWDKTTKSSDYNETQEDSWMLASEIGSEDESAATINYSVSQDAILNLAIYDQDNNLVKNLLANESKAAGTYDIGWDSTDNSGNPVPEGRYYFQFTSPDGPIDSNAYSILPGDWSSQAVNPVTTISDSAGNRYEIAGGVINKYSTANELILTITADMLGVNSLNPVALGMDINDNLFIADKTLSKIFKINNKGYYLAELPGISDLQGFQNLEGLLGIDQPNGILLDNNGDMLIRNKNGTEILKLAVGRGVIDLSNIIAEIRVPYEDSLIYATVPIVGTAAGKGFANYEVAYGVGESPTEWTTLISSGSEIYDDYEPLPPRRTLQGNLATWNTSNIPMGIYTIRLIAYNQEGNYNQDTVVVEVGRVVRRFATTVTSTDGLVTFDLPDNAIPDDADLFSIRSANEPPPVNSTLTLIGDIYEIKPADYRFLKPCTLKMYYTDDQLGGINENTLNIFRWNPVAERWVYVDAELDAEHNLLTTTLSNFNDYEVYYAIMSDSYLKSINLYKTI